MLELPDLSLVDWIAIVWFLACWGGYSLIADSPDQSSDSLMARVHQYRLEWAYTMMSRHNRVVDINVIRNNQTIISFFASTTMLILAGLIAILGTEERALSLLSNLPFAVTTSSEILEVKLLFLIVIFIYAFFKHTWAMRHLNYMAILIAAFPEGVNDFTEAHKREAKRVATLSSMAGKHFNRGLRAYYYGLATLSWFIHPWIFVAISSWTVIILYRREFRSNLVKLLSTHETDRENTTLHI